MTSGDRPGSPSTSGGGAQGVVVRPAAAHDVSALAGIAARAYRAAFAAILDPATLARCDEAFFAGRFGAALPLLLVAETTGAPLGFALATGGTLAMLFVDPHRGGAGAGSALLAAAEAQGVRRLETFRDNAAARRFYEARGWRASLAYRRPLLGGTYAFVSYVKASA